MAGLANTGNITVILEEALSPLATLKKSATVALSHANAHLLLFNRPRRADLWSRYDFMNTF